MCGKGGEENVRGHGSAGEASFRDVLSGSTETRMWVALRTYSQSKGTVAASSARSVISGDAGLPSTLRGQGRVS